MKLDTPFKILFTYDTSDILSSVAALSEVEWRNWTFRQSNFAFLENTEAFPIIWNDATNVLQYHNIKHEVTNAVQPLINKLEEYYNGTATLAIVSRLKPMSNIHVHADKGSRSVICHRCNVELTIDPNTRFVVAETEVPKDTTLVLEISNLDEYYTVNESNSYKVNLIIDILPN